MAQATIEIEFRARFDAATAERLRRFLAEHAQSLGEDDKDVYFFALPDKLLKVVDNVSHKTAKIVLKLARIGHGSGFPEIEMPIARGDAAKAVNMFKTLGFGEPIRSFQKRENFLYHDVEIAVKHSNNWGYHAEFEIMVAGVEDQPAAEDKIRKVANGLGVALMTEEELRDFTSRFEAEHKNVGNR
ncbi:MAG: CYTH domain-containing protein [Patescibacteria group bacterium]